MDHRTLFSTSIRCQQIATENFFDILTTLQNTSGAMLKHSVKQCSWMPDEGIKSYLDWLESVTKNSSDLKEMVDKSYDGMERFWSDQAQSASPKAAARTAKATAAKPKNPRAKAAPAKKAAATTTKAATPKKRATAKAKPATPPTPAKKTAATPPVKKVTVPESKPQAAAITKQPAAAAKSEEK